MLGRWDGVRLFHQMTGGTAPGVTWDGAIAVLRFSYVRGYNRPEAVIRHVLRFNIVLKKFMAALINFDRSIRLKNLGLA